MLRIMLHEVNNISVGRKNNKIFEESYYNGFRTGTVLTVAQMTQVKTEHLYVSYLMLQ